MDVKQEKLEKVRAVVKSLDRKVRKLIAANRAPTFSELKDIALAERLAEEMFLEWETELEHMEAGYQQMQYEREEVGF